jgi:hypothetical protein
VCTFTIEAVPSGTIVTADETTIDEATAAIVLLSDCGPHHQFCFVCILYFCLLMLVIGVPQWLAAAEVPGSSPGARFLFSSTTLEHQQALRGYSLLRARP